LPESSSGSLLENAILQAIEESAKQNLEKMLPVLSVDEPGEPYFDPTNPESYTLAVESESSRVTAVTRAVSPPTSQNETRIE